MCDDVAEFVVQTIFFWFQFQWQKKVYSICHAKVITSENNVLHYQATKLLLVKMIFCVSTYKHLPRCPNIVLLLCLLNLHNLCDSQRVFFRRLATLSHRPALGRFQWLLQGCHFSSSHLLTTHSWSASIFWLQVLFIALKVQNDCIRQLSHISRPWSLECYEPTSF
jgi:hypothetical protein